MILEGYNDTNKISNTKDSKSTSGYVFTLGGETMSHKLYKHICIARSMKESKFIVLDKTLE